MLMQAGRTGSAPYGSVLHRARRACARAVAVAVFTAWLCGCGAPLWRPDLGGAQRLAAERNQVVIVQVYSPFSADCWRMANEVFADPDVQQSLRTVIPVRINALWDNGFRRDHGLVAIPSFVALAPDGTELRQAGGYLDADGFRAFVELSKLSN